MYIPNIRDFIYLSDNSFTKDEVKLCLVDVFRSNHYSLAIPLSLTFLRRFSKISGVSGIFCIYLLRIQSHLIYNRYITNINNTFS